MHAASWTSLYPFISICQIKGFAVPVQMIMSQAGTLSDTPRPNLTCFPQIAQSWLSMHVCSGLVIGRPSLGKRRQSMNNRSINDGPGGGVDAHTIFLKVSLSLTHLYHFHRLHSCSYNDKHYTETLPVRQSRPAGPQAPRRYGASDSFSCGFSTRSYRPRRRVLFATC